MSAREEGEEKFRTRDKVRREMRKDTEWGRRTRVRVDCGGVGGNQL